MKENQFEQELKAFLKKWDAEIWAERDEFMRTLICYAAKLSDERVIEGSFKRFVNGRDTDIGEMRKRETEEEPLPQFVKELKELLKKWDAEIWAERNEFMRLHICYAAKLSDERVIEGSFKRFVNGDDECHAHTHFLALLPRIAG